MADKMSYRSKRARILKYKTRVPEHLNLVETTQGDGVVYFSVLYLEKEAFPNDVILFRAPVEPAGGWHSAFSTGKGVRQRTRRREAKWLALRGTEIVGGYERGAKVTFQEWRRSMKTL